MPPDDGLDRNSPAYGIAVDVCQSIRTVAGLGAGKSFAVKPSVAHLLDTGVAPGRVLPVTFTNGRPSAKRIRAYDAAWAQLQHDEPGYETNPDDKHFERMLIDWLWFHKDTLNGKIIPQVCQ